MKYPGLRHAIKFSIDVRLASCLNLRSGAEGEFADTSLQRTPDGDLCVNGYVWAGLIRRALRRTTNGMDLAADIGKHDLKNPLGVSPLWCDSSHAELNHLHATYIIPGIRIDREMGSDVTGALYEQEVVTPGLGLTLTGNLFVQDGNVTDARNLLMDALWVIDDGIETIGGSWSYGQGRLAIEHVRLRALDLSKPDERKLLWAEDAPSWDTDQAWEEAKKIMQTPAISRPWSCITIKAAVQAGQLLAIHTSIPPDGFPVSSEMPDTFVMRLPWCEQGGYTVVPVITGKTFRQAVLSQAIERRHRSQPGSAVCMDSTSNGKCRCKRCQWFGNTELGGIVSVADTPVRDASTVTLHRIQLCEHTHQNMHLFSGEYLTKGSFCFEIIVDRDAGGDPEGLINEIELLIKEIQYAGPTGWHRLGATSTCTGQFEIKDYSMLHRGGLL